MTVFPIPTIYDLALPFISDIGQRVYEAVV